MKNSSECYLEVFFLTYNRAPLLRESVESILNQTVKNIKISILDNASTDNTSEIALGIIKDFPERKIEYIRNEKNAGFFGNFEKALSLTECKYVLLSHDDDLFHPLYLEYALKLISREKNVALVTTRCSHDISLIKNKSWRGSKPKTLAFVFPTHAHLAAHYVYGGQAIFASAIYNAEYLKKYSEPNTCGKIGDTNYMVNVAKGGKSFVFCDGNLFFSRSHSGQDSCDKSNGPYENEILNLHNYFKEILLNSPSPIHRFIFKIRYAERFYKYLKFSGMGKKEAMKVLSKLPSKNVSGKMFRIYPIPLVGNIARGACRILSLPRKIDFLKPRVRF